MFSNFYIPIQDASSSLTLINDVGCWSCAIREDENTNAQPTKIWGKHTERTQNI